MFIVGACTLWIAIIQVNNVVGMENHTCSDLSVATTAAVATRLGKDPFIGLFNQCAWNAADEGESIHSAIQLEAYGHDVNDKATAFGGKRMMTTLRVTKSL